MLNGPLPRPAGRRHSAPSLGARRNARRRLSGVAILVLLFSLPALAKSPPRAVSVTDNSFRCITDMTRVGHLYVDNLAGNLKGTVAVAKSPTGGSYPVGSVVQLLPTEAMVKREQGFSPATMDWEFFDLDVDRNGTRIWSRGVIEENNRFGGNCFACHAKARPEWDLVCEDGHGCDPKPVTRAMSGALQRTDPRCRPEKPVSAEDAEALKQLAVLLQAMKAANATNQ